MHRLALLILLAASAWLALDAARGDSVTVDEPCHLISGLSHLRGDYRLNPEHPPLAKLWAALPLLGQPWPGPETPGFREADCDAMGRAWMAAPRDPDRLIQPARVMMVVLLLALVLAVHGCARRVFGEGAGLLAAGLAALDPGLLAHGHYVTTDVPLALATLASFAAASRFLELLSVPRFLALAAALAALSLVKLSWVLALPGLAAMGLAAILRPAPLVVGVGRRRLERTSRSARAAILGGAALALAGIVVLAIWAAYGFRSSPFPPGEDRAMLRTASDFGRPRPTTLEAAWETVLHDPVSALPRAGPTAAFVRQARAHRLLPEAYLYGIAYAEKKALYRSSYLRGEYSLTGFRSYFPTAFAIKTPLGSLILMVAGLAAVAARRARPADGLLGLGLLAFAGIHAAAAIGSHLNLGHRHLLPVYPVAFVLASASIAWARWPAGRLVLGAAGLWTLGSVLANHPHHLAYFNELAGGPARGHLHLADSNLDWGQDLLRLAAYARAHPDETLKLAQFGDVPLPAGFRPEILLGDTPGPRAPLTPGTYAISATELLGVYRPLLRSDTWRDPEVLARAGFLRAASRDPWLSAERRAQLAEEDDLLRRARLIERLRQRPPDARAGWSLFLYRVEDVDATLELRP